MQHSRLPTPVDRLKTTPVRPDHNPSPREKTWFSFLPFFFTDAEGAEGGRGRTEYMSFIIASLRLNKPSSHKIEVEVFNTFIYLVQLLQYFPSFT